MRNWRLQNLALWKATSGLWYSFVMVDEWDSIPYISGAVFRTLKLRRQVLGLLFLCSRDILSQTFGIVCKTWRVMKRRGSLFLGQRSFPQQIDKLSRWSLSGPNQIYHKIQGACGVRCWALNLDTKGIFKFYLLRPVVATGQAHLLRMLPTNRNFASQRRLS